jgi:hypothetical protein
MARIAMVVSIALTATPYARSGHRPHPAILHDTMQLITDVKDA